ncbi:hypothetical protein ALQ78_02985 [Pseudomonas syringae pv. aptata]|uniref:ORC-CDC6 family AAA ATPase n=1 Tax=Pseudomonas syringae TaxID=317 RepID=UPI000F008DC0|nr:hypothetical protein [Pseudomonas syringae]RMM44379.1 hypothetical protein ALQ78_02985 [Pseudomonas syringae pv. aptata]
MNRFDNPFHDLWVTEILAPDEFVKMFSPVVASHSEELFGTGNVVIKGRQGSGKSMLLSLLNTRTRVAYARSGAKYPAPNSYKSFIAAGIHLIRDNARIVASRLSELPSEKRRDWAATTFADYVNYILIQDLIANVKYLANEQARDDVLKSELPIKWTHHTQEKLAQCLKGSAAWYGYLEDCVNFDSIEKKINNRITEYRKYFNFNTDNLPADVESTKTDIGEPTAVFADALRQAGVISHQTLVYLRIDQHEELYELEKSSGNARVFRQVINRALAMRDGRVAYRVGTRHYAWGSDVTIWGSGAHLENMRDYSIIDIDEILKRHEKSSLGISFNDFAEDVFKRRLTAYGFDLAPNNLSLLRTVFGKTLTPTQRARIYVKEKPFSLNIPSEWSAEWKQTIMALWETDPLAAKLSEVWLRQKQQQKEKVYLYSAVDSPLVWKERRYWIKERNEAALIQLAGDAKEMLIWSGDRHILDLSGWNILAFMTICRAIWAAWLRSTPDEELQKTNLPEISMDKQVIGIYEASRIWADKLREGADGDKRLSFINSLGAWLSTSIRNDRSLSYPGHTGFSIFKRDFEKSLPVTDLLKSCRDQGDLIESEHTTKSSDGIPRIKWYLNPLLCPYFRIPHVRTKEPIYTTLVELNDILVGNSLSTKVKNIDDFDPPIQSELF